LIRRVGADQAVAHEHVPIREVVHHPAPELVVALFRDGLVEAPPPDAVVGGRLVDDELVLR
jgi:hypothetical protein